MYLGNGRMATKMKKQMQFVIPKKMPKILTSDLYDKNTANTANVAKVVGLARLACVCVCAHIFDFFRIMIRI